jgi:signal transduction histidine kinase
MPQFWRRMMGSVGIVPSDNGGLAKILVVNRDPGIIHATLGSRYDVRMVAGREDAIEQLVEWKPDLILADSACDGFHICRDVKSDPATRMTPVVLIVPDSQSEAVEEGSRAGTDEFLFTPFHPHVLLARVRCVMTALAMRRQAETQARQAADEHVRGAEARAAQERAQFLAEASELLDSSLDFEATLAHIARILVPRLAEDIAHRSSLALDNARLYHQAQEAIHTRDEFLSIASHELKTPLTSLKLNVQSILRSAERGQILPERILPAIDNIHRQTDRLSKLIESLLDVSRIAAGRLTLDREDVDLAGVVPAVVERFKEELQRSGSTVTIRGDAPAIGKWDRFRMEQVVTNLVSNAIKYGQGKPLALTVCANGASVALTVRDQGIGIAPADLARLFQPFERAVSPRHYGGLGMGLYIVRQIVEAHGGSVDVDSAPGKGSTFVVRLPVDGRPSV